MRKSADMVEFPVRQPDGCALLDFIAGREADLDRLDPSVPLTASLVVVWNNGQCLLVFNRFRSAWELPGGMIDRGETAREAAVRELVEESGQPAEALGFAGTADVWYAPAERREHLALYTGAITERAAFVPNDEMTGSLWWTPGAPLPDLQPIDAALVRLCPSGPTD